MPCRVEPCSRRWVTRSACRLASDDPRSPPAARRRSSARGRSRHSPVRAGQADGQDDADRHGKPRGPPLQQKRGHCGQATSAMPIVGVAGSPWTWPRSPMSRRRTRPGFRPEQSAARHDPGRRGEQRPAQHQPHLEAVQPLAWPCGAGRGRNRQAATSISGYSSTVVKTSGATSALKQSADAPRPPTSRGRTRSGGGWPAGRPPTRRGTPWPSGRRPAGGAEKDDDLRGARGRPG